MCLKTPWYSARLFLIGLGTSTFPDRGVGPVLGPRWRLLAEIYRSVGSEVLFVPLGKSDTKSLQNILGASLLCPPLFLIGLGTSAFPDRGVDPGSGASLASPRRDLSIRGVEAKSESKVFWKRTNCQEVQPRQLLTRGRSSWRAAA